MRLRLRAEIRRRISRIDIDFNATFNDDGTVVYHQQDGSGRFVDIAPHQFGECAGPLVRVQFVNGTERLIILDGDKAVLLWTACLLRATGDCPRCLIQEAICNAPKTALNRPYFEALGFFV